jgi:hypothetical protein
MAGQQLPSYDAYQQVYGQQPDQGGFMGLLSSPVAQGLLGAGLGALASRGTTAQAIGRGGLLGLSAYGQALDTQNNRLLQMAQAKLQQDALAKMTPGEDGAISVSPATFLQAGFSDPSKWADIRNAGRDKLKQVQEVTGADGSKSLFGVNEYGGVHGMGLTNAPEIKTQDIGGQVIGWNPYTGQQSSAVNKSLTPDQVQDTANQPFMMVNGQIVANPAYQAYSKAKAAAGAARTSVQVNNKMGESLAGQIGPMMKDSQIAADAAVKQVQAANSIDQALNSGQVITGPTANARLTVAQWADTLGMGGQDQKSKLENTRSAMQGLAQLTLQGRQQMRGQGAITENESKLAERAISGDLNLTPPELRVLSNAARRAGQHIYGEHQRKLQAVSNNPDFSPMVPFYAVPEMPAAPAAPGGNIDDLLSKYR